VGLYFWVTGILCCVSIVLTYCLFADIVIFELITEGVAWCEMWTETCDLLNFLTQVAVEDFEGDFSVDFRCNWSLIASLSDFCDDARLMPIICHCFYCVDYTYIFSVN
jgi:hypothetical protein